MLEGEDLYQQIIIYLLNNFCHNKSIGTSESGWTDHDQANKWVAQVFIPAALEQQIDKEKPILFLIDGHNSHESLEFKSAVYQGQGDADIITMCFPSKCTHKVQLLDVGVFSHTQNAWKCQHDKLLQQNIPVNHYNVVQAYMESRSEYMTSNLIKKAFKSSGISPLNPEIFTEEDYAPSQQFSIVAHVPKSFPTEVPSSPMTAIATELNDSGNDEYRPSNDSGEYEHDAISITDSSGVKSGNTTLSGNNLSESESEEVPISMAVKYDILYEIFDLEF